jgi:hypothetical protein
VGENCATIALAVSEDKRLLRSMRQWRSCEDRTAMFRELFRRDYPDSALTQREVRRENRIFAILIGVPLLLFLSFMAYYFLAPWEVAYRIHATAVYQAQIEAMPPHNTDHLQQVLVRNRDGLSVLAEYSRNELCAPVLD